MTEQADKKGTIKPTCKPGSCRVPAESQPIRYKVDGPQPNVRTRRDRSRANRYLTAAARMAANDRRRGSGADADARRAFAINPAISQCSTIVPTGSGTCPVSRAARPRQEINANSEGNKRHSDQWTMFRHCTHSTSDSIKYRKPRAYLSAGMLSGSELAASMEDRVRARIFALPSDPLSTLPLPTTGAGKLRARPRN